MATYMEHREGFDITSDAYIDKRIVLTKFEMLTAHDDFILPDKYFAYCSDDESWYSFDKDNDIDPETGKYRQITPKDIVLDVVLNSESIVNSEGIAEFVIDYPVEDVMVDNVSVMEGKRAKIDLTGKQDLLVAGDHIEIDSHNRISALPFDHLEPKAGYGTFVDSEGHINLDNSVILTRDDMPTKLSDFTNDVPFITASVDNLTNYYVKNSVYTKTEIDDILSNFSGGIELEIVAVLPLSGEDNTIYLVRRDITGNVYDQYIWYNNQWTQIGSTEIDLSSYYTKSEVDALVAAKADPYTAGSGISISNNVISANISELPVATPATAGMVKYDNDTIKQNAYGQLYADVQGGGKEYTAGQNIYFTNNGTTINATTGAEYSAGDGIAISANNKISVKTDDETVFTNRYGELYVDAVPIEAGDGIKIRNGVIQVDRTTVPYESDLNDKQDKLVAGNNITIVGNVISATGGGSGGGANWGEIGGSIYNQADLQSALNNKVNNGVPVSYFTNDAGYITSVYHDPSKQDTLVAGANITIEGNVISSTGGGSGPSQVNWGGIKGTIGNQTDLMNLLNTKANTSQIPTVNNGSVTLQVNGQAVGGFTTNQGGSQVINIPVSSSTPNNGVLTLRQGSTTLGSFSADQSYNTTIDIPGGSTPNDGRLTIMKNGTTVGTFTANQAGNVTANLLIPTFEYDEDTGILYITD